MIDLLPFQPKRTAPLSGGARFIRGFTRIGAAAAVLVVLIGVVTTGLLAKEIYSDNVNAFANATCVAKVARTRGTLPYYKTDLDYEAIGCPDSGIRYKSQEEVLAIAKDGPFAVERTATLVGWGLVITGPIAVGVYLAFWCIGWVFAGFTRDA
jgi:hypothetical protein